jgi:hypothetical protein
VQSDKDSDSSSNNNNPIITPDKGDKNKDKTKSAEQLVKDNIARLQSLLNAK